MTDVDGRVITFTYTDKGLMAEMLDGAGSGVGKKFQFVYDADETNKNTKLVSVTDPRGNATSLSYFDAPTDPKAKWMLQSLTDRENATTEFAYVDPDGAGGAMIETTVTDAKSNATFYRMDGFGRPVLSRNAKNETTTLEWDADHNVSKLIEDNGATTSWTYDPDTGYRTLIKDAEANRNSTAGTVLSYRTAVDGHVADLTKKVTPEGRSWQFSYDTVGNLLTVTDPAGVATMDVPDDYQTTYGYWPASGLLETVTDANGHMTRYSNYDQTGVPRTVTDAKGNQTKYTLDDRGNVLTVTDAAQSVSRYGWDVFGRLLEQEVPKTGDKSIVTPAPEYDGNDNVTTATAPNGAVTTYAYDKSDRLTSTVLPKDATGDPERKATFAYDVVGNLLSETEPKGNLTPDNPDDFTTKYVYDAVYQLTSVTNADAGELTYAYDNVGNVTTIKDPRKNASEDPDDVTVTSVYDWNHRVTSTTDAAGETETTQYDKDGLVTQTTDKRNHSTTYEYDPRGLVSEVAVPRADGDINTTRLVYDEVGNRINVISPRGVATTADDSDYLTETVYDELNRVSEEIHPYDPDDARYNTPDKTIYSYDVVGNLTKVSAPPSEGQTVRNITSYEHFKNGWVQSSTDAWDIATTYDYNDLGQQTSRTVTSAGGSSSRSMSWTYTPDGKLKTRSDEGVPIKDVRLVDDSDTGNVAKRGTWTDRAAGSGSDYSGYGFKTHVTAWGDGSDYYQWKPRVNKDGTYQVFVRIPAGYAGLATAAPYTVTHAGGTSTKDVDQSANAGQWVLLGSYGFTRAGAAEHQIRVNSTGTGEVAADAVKLVRVIGSEVEREAKQFAYGYDPNGNLTQVTDSSWGAKVDEYAIGYTGLNQVAKVEELNAGSVVNTTRFSYDPNGNPETRVHDDQHAAYAYDVRDLVSKVTNGKAADDPDPKVTEYTYSPNGQTDVETKPNGNTVDHDYYWDGLLQHQLETKADGTTVVSEHTVSYDPNGNKSRDVSKVRDADTGELRDRTHTYTYDPRDRTSGVTKTDTSDGSSLSSESYVHDAASNVVSQTIDDVTTNFVYDRNRLLTATTSGVTAAYNYDPYGRLDTVVSGSTVVERYDYDGFDRIKQHEKLNDTGGTDTTKYSYDPMDRTASTTDKGGEKTEFEYLGLSGEVLNESIGGEVQKSYTYSPWGKRLSQIKQTDTGGEESSFYGYSPHTDVETLTTEFGDTKATYGYTAYGSDDVEEFTGVDKPDAGTPGEEPYNVYRYSAKRWDAGSGTYDMGFRDYAPSINRFLTRDMYNGALADLNLGLSQWTGNRYAFTGGNPTTLIEIDGHRICEDDCSAGERWVDPESGEIHEPDPEPRCYGYDCAASSGDVIGTNSDDEPQATDCGLCIHYEYHIKFPIGPVDEVGTPEHVMDVFAENPTEVFPFEVEGCDEFITGTECRLYAGPAIFGGVGDVYVTRRATSVEFTVTSEDYFDAAGAVIEFKTSTYGGTVYLEQNAEADARVFGWLGVQLGVAQSTWRNQANNLREFLGGEKLEVPPHTPNNWGQW